MLVFSASVTADVPIHGWTIATSKAANYRQVCAEAAADDSIFASFKRNASYTPILEHASQRMGVAYLKHVETTNPKLLEGSLWNGFQANDAIGGAHVRHFASALHPEGIHASSSSLRYVSVLADIIKYFGDNAFRRPALRDDTVRPWDVCEIGGGYGGLAHMVLTYGNSSRQRRGGGGQ